MLMLMPDRRYALGALVGAVSAGGVIYMIASGASQNLAESDLGIDDLIWYVVLPYVSYAALGASAVMIWRAAPFGPHVEAGAILLLLLIGIRNAWDLVVYSVQRRTGE